MKNRARIRQLIVILSLATAPAPVSFLLGGAFPARAEAQARNVSGRWKVLVETGEGTRDYFVEIRQEGEKITGNFISPRSGSFPIEQGSFKEGKLRVTVPRNGRVFVVEAELKGEKLEGKLLIDGEESGSVAITREAPSIAGKWNVVTMAGDDEHKSTMLLSEEGGALKGKAESALGSFDMKSLSWKEAKFSFEIVLPIQGNEVTFVVHADLVDADTLRGKWKARDAEISGDWSAKREAPLEPARPQPEVASPPGKGLAGEWFGVSALPDGKKVGFKLELRSEGGKPSGKISFGDRTVDLTEIKVEGGKLEARVAYRREGQSEDVRIQGELQGDALEGRWSSGAESGAWTARKPTRL